MNNTKIELHFFPPTNAYTFCLYIYIHFTLAAHHEVIIDLNAREI